MITVFWVATVLMLGCACLFALPWIGIGRAAICVVLCIYGVAYGLYARWGSSHYLTSYYSTQEKQQRAQQRVFRPLWIAFRKEEFRLRLRLEENPQDIDAEWRLLDLLAIKAINQGDIKIAREYWGLALKKIPNTIESQPIQTMILEQLRQFKP